MKFEKKRYGMLGQLVNQAGPWLAINQRNYPHHPRNAPKRKASTRRSQFKLPYSYDQDFKINTHNFVTYSAGRIMFVPALWCALLLKNSEIAQDTRFSHSTRTHSDGRTANAGNASRGPGVNDSAPIYSLRVPEVFQAMETPKRLVNSRGKVARFAYGDNVLSEQPHPPEWQKFNPPGSSPF